MYHRFSSQPRYAISIPGHTMEEALKNAGFSMDGGGGSGGRGGGGNDGEAQARREEQEMARNAMLKQILTTEAKERCAFFEATLDALFQSRT